MNRSGYCSSEEEDGDEKWKAAINSAAAVDYIYSSKNGAEETEKRESSPGFKLCQTRARKLLDGMLEGNLEFVRQDPTVSSQSNRAESDGFGVRLFRAAPLGIVFEAQDGCVRRPQKRPRILPHLEIEERSEEFKERVRRVAVHGDDVIAGANVAAQICLARYEARDGEAKAAAKREEERVAHLKKLRGEKWLPSLAREKVRSAR